MKRMTSITRSQWRKNQIIRQFDRTYKGYTDIIGVVLIVLTIVQLVCGVKEINSMKECGIVNFIFSGLFAELAYQAFKFGRL